MKVAKQGTKAFAADYAVVLKDIKTRIRTAQVRAALSANLEMIRLYWDIGRIIAERQKQAGWGAAVIPRLSRDIRNEITEVKGFSERNIDRMIAFYREYPELENAISPTALAKLAPIPISPTALAKLETTVILHRLVPKLPWVHNVLLMQKVKDLSTRYWYMQATLQHGWSHDVLALMIDGRTHERQGKAITNFADRLPPLQSDLAQQVVKDPFIFDFMTLEEPFHERELETSLVRHLEKFLVELGQGFAFVGRQVHLDVGEQDFYIDLLFYHLRLRCFVVIELKKGAFKPEYAGKLNFYLNVVDEKLRHASDSPSIGLILCQDENRLVAEYALKGVAKAIGVSQYQLTRALPKEFRSSLPSVADIESELSATTQRKPVKTTRTRRRS
ncbi:MAG: PDDEXK nuclease domain-containing protein [bacterium]